MFPSRIASILGGGAGLQNNYSLALDGSNDYVDTGATFQSTFRGSFSISCWIKPDDGQPSATEFIMGSRNSAQQDGLELINQTTGKLKFYYESNDKVVRAETVSYTHLTLPTIYSV